MNKALMTATQVCQELNISRPTLYKRVNEGIIKCVRYGRDYRFNSNHIEDLKEGATWQQEEKEYKNVRGRPIGTYTQGLKVNSTKNLQELLNIRKQEKLGKSG
tara:strand:+ start:203 stop:511 length:309 start_codon:yes stop_codon:yes gene_type:complete